ncbi:MAG: type I-A CRISPR-associated protein Cas5a [Candidatus Methanodesulfokora sp.]
MSVAFSADLEFVWGFQARAAGLSKTPPSFYYPPPTTFLGALAESIARKIGIGESAGREMITALSRNVLAVGIRPINCVPLKYEDINKIIAVKWTSGVLHPSPGDLAGSYDSPARGKTVMMSLDDSSPALRIIVVLKKDEIELRGRKVRIEEDHLWGIHRLGSKESRISVVDVKRQDAKAEEGRTTSKCSFPVMEGIKLLEELQRKWLYEVYVNPREVIYGREGSPALMYIEGRSLIPFRIPIMVTRAGQPEFAVEVKSPAAFYRVGEDVVIGWKA